MGWELSWFWFWVILAVILFVGEIFTAGFFLLPFSLGAVAAALGEIPEEQREVVVLRIYGQLRFREIAELLSISINTVQSRHRYALDALRARLTPRGAER